MLINKLIKLAAAVTLALGTIGVAAAAPVNAASAAPTFSASQPTPGTYEVPYTVHKAGTTQPSLASSFFTGQATVVVGAKTTVTLHVQRYASMIKTFKIGAQAAKVTTIDADKANLTFDVNADFAQPTVSAELSVMNMTQKADIAFSTPLYAATQSVPAPPATATDMPADQPATDTQPPAPDQAATSIEVPYTINKAHSDKPSLANDFFTGSATVHIPADHSQATVTLHLQKFANMIKSFAIGTQAATITNATANTADLSFKLDASFAQATVAATMAVMNMNQQADIIFAQALYPLAEAQPGTTPDTDDQAGTTQQSKPDAQTPTTADPEEPATKPAATNASVAIYQANAGQLTHSPSAAATFIDPHAIISPAGAQVQLRLHTTGIDYIDEMTLLGHAAKVVNRQGNEADLLFTLPNDALGYALPATFKLTIPGGVQMTQSAFVLVNLPIAKAKPYHNQKAPVTTTPAALPTAAGAGAGASAIFDPNAASQNVPYSVLDQSRSGLSTANNYFTHTARVVKVANGYDVYLTVRATTGLVAFTPVSFNGQGVTHLSKTTAGGFDTWTFAFHVATASALAQPIPATIRMSVPIAGIHDVTFNIWLAFNQTLAGGVNYEQTLGAANSLPAALAPITLTRHAQKLAPAVHKVAAAPLAQTNTEAAEHAQAGLPKLQSYPFFAELAAFVALALAIIGFAFYRRHANLMKKD